MNDRFLRACRREPVDRPPLWIMRQAGRYLPEYRALRARVDFLTLCRTPELAAEASLQPIRRFGLDAAIVFSDILLPVAAMGCELRFEPGPRLDRPLRTRADVEALRVEGAAERTPWTAAAVKLLRRELDGSTPVIGFCGAPFTLAAYLTEGSGGSGFGAVKRMMMAEPATLERLLDKLAHAMADHLNAQLSAGAQAVQIFDSWAGLLSPADYRRFALAPVQRLMARLERRGAPVIYFAPAAGHVLEASLATGADVLGVCWRTPLDEARRRAAGRVALQGNLDPHVLFAPPDRVHAEVEAMLDAGEGPGWIANLGHGILPDTPLEAVQALVDAVAARAGRPA